LRLRGTQRLAIELHTTDHGTRVVLVEARRVQARPPVEVDVVLVVVVVLVVIVVLYSYANAFDGPGA
jgi:hypothetical protein